MVCSVHWYAYSLGDGNFKFISFYVDCCLYKKHVEYHSMFDGFGSMIDFNENHFEFLPHDFEFISFF